MGSCKLILFLYSWRHHQLNLCLSSLVFIFSFEKITASPVCSTASLPQLLKVFPGTYRESFLLLLTALHRLFISSLPWPFMCLNPVLPFFFCGSCCLDLWSFSSFFLHSLSTFFFFFWGTVFQTQYCISDEWSANIHLSFKLLCIPGEHLIFFCCSLRPIFTHRLQWTKQEWDPLQTSAKHPAVTLFTAVQFIFL